jgi:seryl-tRNA synthetase
MSHSGVEPDFDLGDDILAVIPTDPYDQLDLARKITSMAIASRVSKLESEVAHMRHKLYEKDRLVVELEERVSRLDHDYQEAHSRLKNVVDENVPPFSFSCFFFFLG